MKRAAAVRWFLIALTGVLVVAANLWLLGWRPWDDPSIVPFESESAYNREKVENGSAFDRAAVELGTAKKVVLPHDAVVRRSGEPGQVLLLLKKTLAFGGHPPERMSIRGARKNMGCAVRVEGDALVIATFGEWDSRIEGGAFMRVVAVVPDGVEVEQRKGLSGPDSAGREWHGQWLTKPRDAKGGYWYGPASPAEGWAAVPDVPDPDSAERPQPQGEAAALQPAWSASWAALGVSGLVVWMGVLAGVGLRWRFVGRLLAGLGAAAGVAAFLADVFVAWQAWAVLSEYGRERGVGRIRAAVGLGLMAVVVEVAAVVFVVRWGGQPRIGPGAPGPAGGVAEPSAAADRGGR